MTARVYDFRTTHQPPGAWATLLGPDLEPASAVDYLAGAIGERLLEVMDRGTGEIVYSSRAAHPPEGAA